MNSPVKVRFQSKMFAAGQDVGMHAAPIHLIDEIGGMGGIYLSNIVVNQRSYPGSSSSNATASPTLRYDATTCGHGPSSPCPNLTSLRGSSIFIRPPKGQDWKGCGPATAAVSLDGTILPEGRLFGQRDVFENLTIVCCTPEFIAAHPHDWQTFDGCRDLI